MTDLAALYDSVPNRLGVNGRFVDGELHLDLTPHLHTLHHGIVRASVIAYLVDCVAGIGVDDDPELWTLTSDMTVRMRPLPAPALIHADNAVLRRGRRSITCRVELTDDTGSSIASGAIGFAKFPRREGDPVKPVIGPERAGELFPNAGGLTQPLRDEVGIAVIETGVVEVLVTPQLRNPAGTLQGAMVALVAEAAAEDLAADVAGQAMTVTDLDIRYLAQAQVGPVRATATLLGDTPDSAIQVELVDTSNDRLTTLVYARAVPITPA